MAGFKEMSTLVPTLKQHLFSETLKTYAVLDGASIPGLRKKFHYLKPEHICLYRGELKPDLAECAPYLVRLQPEAEFTDWVLTEGWGQHWGIFAQTAADLTALRKHFRTFLMVKDPNGEQVYFRYYDPRVLRVYLPTCNPDETRYIFGPVKSYFCEDEVTYLLLVFSADDTGSKKQALKLA